MRTPAAFAAGFDRALKWGGEEKKEKKEKKGESSSEKTDSD
jgi:hypothetical protein